jgi:hypothetical protein
LPGNRAAVRALEHALYELAAPIAALIGELRHEPVIRFVTARAEAAVEAKG